jgi:hypothetical protein
MADHVAKKTGLVQELKKDGTRRRRQDWEHRRIA